MKRIRLPDLKTNDILIISSRVPDDQSIFDRSFLLQHISPEERDKYHRFHFDKDKKLYLLSHALLRMSLARYIGCSSLEVQFDKNDYGKPHLKGNTTLSFNLSHSKKALALVISQLPLHLGIDIESFVDQGEVINLAHHYFAKTECQQLHDSSFDMQSQTFFKFWTLKESYIKAIGKGLSIDLGAFAFGSLNKNISIAHYHESENAFNWQFYQSQIFTDYFLALAIRSKPELNHELKIKTLEYLPSHEFREMQLPFVR